jgi:hypothetical protein
LSRRLIIAHFRVLHFLTGDHNVCRNLARIASSVCLTRLSHGTVTMVDTGMINLLQKIAAHPSVNISGLSLEALARLTQKGNLHSHELLPILQRRAIIPHHFQLGVLSLSAEDLCGVCFHEFENFRNTVLKEALLACWKQDGRHYMDSCTSAVVEFCSDRPSVELSLQLEAALFCIESVAVDVLDSVGPFPHGDQLKTCTDALKTKPPSLISNPVTLARMCKLIRKYRSWYTDQGGLEVIAELVMSTYLQEVSSNPEQGPMQDAIRESHVSPVSEALLTLKELLCATPRYFANEGSLKTLSGRFVGRKNCLCLSEKQLTVILFQRRLGSFLFILRNGHCYCQRSDRSLPWNLLCACYFASWTADGSFRWHDNALYRFP